MFAGAFMMGANDRLLPPLIPFRFFASAMVFHAVGWGILLIDADQLTHFAGGMGGVLAGLHAITLGVLLMSAMGAAFQMLPVATRKPLGPLWFCQACWWLFAPGVVVLCFGLLTEQPLAWGIGGAGCVLGGGLFAALVVRNLWQVGDMPEITWHGWAAMGCMLLMLVLAALLLGDFSQAWLADHRAIAMIHAVLASYGVMGNLLLGFSYILIPMFVLGRPVPQWMGRTTAILLLSAIGLGCVGILLGWVWLVCGGVLVGLAAYGLFLWAMQQVMQGRMRKKLEPFFRLLCVGWVVLPLSTMPLLAALFFPDVADFLLLWGWMVIFGGLLTVVTAILQRIMPFLASMHSGARGGKPILVSRLTDGPLLPAHALCHVLAIVLVVVGMAGGWSWLVALGCLCGLTGALCFALFGMEMMRRYRRHERNQPIT